MTRATTLPFRSTAPTTISLPAPPVPGVRFGVSVLILAADIGFVNLDDAHQLAEFGISEAGAHACACGRSL
jgi:hypothetical protein